MLCFVHRNCLGSLTEATTDKKFGEFGTLQTVVKKVNGFEALLGMSCEL